MLAIDIKNSKGGVGKSTTAINLAGYLKMQFPQSKVALLNKDYQGSVKGFHLRASPEYFDCQIFDVINTKQEAKGYDYVIIDHRPDADGRTFSDFVICPTLPETFSLDSTQAFINRLDRKKVFVAQLLNRVEPVRSHLKYAEYKQFANNKLIAKRQAYPDMIDEGKSIFQKPDNRIHGLPSARKEFTKAIEQVLTEYRYYKMSPEERQEMKKEYNLPEDYLDYVFETI